MVEPPDPSRPAGRAPIDDLSEQTEVGEPDPALSDDENATPDESVTLAIRMRRRAGRRERIREFARGESVGRYVILEKLGAGAMGVVYSAWDPDLDRKIALKLLHGQRHGERLLREAQAMARLSHPNVITVHDVGEVDGRVFMAMEFIEGATLADWVRERPREVGDILAMFIAAGRGLAAAHEGGLVHRDFKPDNVMIGSDGRVRVMDFGLVRAAGEADPLGSPDDDRSALESSSGDHLSRATALSSSSVLQSRLTQEGSLLGTPAFMSPEQLRGEPADARSDQFAFCIALWECLFGQRPFEGGNPLAVLFAITQADIKEPPAGRPVPGSVRRVIVRGLAANPATRWPNMPALLSALSDDPRVRTRRISIAAGSLAVTVLVGLAVAISWPAPPRPPCEDVADPINAIWTDASADQLRASFVASELGYADDTATRVIGELDRWSGEWSAARRDACEATEVRREQSTDMLDRRMACLDQRLLGFEALLELYADADPTIVEKAIDAAEGLPAVAPCNDRSWLSAAVRPPEDQTLAAQVETLQREIARIDARAVAGKAGDARELAEQVDLRARELDWPAIEARAALARGRVEQDLGDFGPARESLSRAYYLARRTNDDEAAAIAATWLVYGSAVGFGDAIGGLHWLRLAEVEADRLGRADLRAEVDSSAGIHWYMQDDMERAAEAFAAALEQHDQGGSGPSERGAAHVNYGTVIIRLDNRRYAEQAIFHIDEGIGLIEQALGPDHPQLGLALSNAATVHGDLDDRDQAITLLERALDILQRSYGLDHPITALTQLNLSANLWASTSPDLPRALELAEASLAVHEQVLGPDSVMTAESLLAIARARFSLHQSALALPPLDRAIEIWERSPARESAVAARFLRISCLLELGRLDDATLELDEIAGRYADSPARVESAKSLLMIAETLVEVPEHRHRVTGLLALARVGIERTGDTRLLAILGELARRAATRP